MFPQLFSIIFFSIFGCKNLSALSILELICTGALEIKREEIELGRHVVHITAKQYNLSEVSKNRTGADGLQVTIKYEKRLLVVMQIASKKSTKMRATRAARLSLKIVMLHVPYNVILKNMRKLPNFSKISNIDADPKVING